MLEECPERSGRSHVQPSQKRRHPYRAIERELQKNCSVIDYYHCNTPFHVMHIPNTQTQLTLTYTYTRIQTNSPPPYTPTPTAPEEHPS